MRIFIQLCLLLAAVGYVSANCKKNDPCTTTCCGGECYPWGDPNDVNSCKYAETHGGLTCQNTPGGLKCLPPPIPTTTATPQPTTPKGQCNGQENPITFWGNVHSQWCPPGQYCNQAKQCVPCPKPNPGGHCYNDETSKCRYKNNGNPSSECVFDPWNYYCNSQGMCVPREPPITPPPTGTCKSWENYLWFWGDSCSKYCPKGQYCGSVGGGPLNCMPYPKPTSEGQQCYWQEDGLFNFPPWASQCGGRSDLYCYSGSRKCTKCPVPLPTPTPVVCFPARATASLPSGTPIRMDQLSIGDKIAVAKADGSVAFEDVYLFGHRDAKSVAEYLTLTLEGSNSTLSLSKGHFLPVSDGTPASATWASHRMTRGGDVRAGMTAWAVGPSGEMEAFLVKEVSVSLMRGMYNPFTMSGSIIIDGVAASAHSEWFLDAIAPESLVPHLPAIYQAALYPARLAYNFFGAELVATADAKLDFNAAGAKGGLVPYVTTFAKALALGLTGELKAAK